VAKAQSAEQAVENSPRYARAADQRPLLKTLARTLRARRYSIRTEQAYVDWCHRFLLYTGKQDPERLAGSDVEGFLAHLAADRNVAASTQNQALNALVFLFREVLERPLEDLRFARARRPPRVPVVLTRDEVRALLESLQGIYALLGRLMYGTGLRLMECLRLRVGDLDFGNRLIVVRGGKGAKDRVVPLPDRLGEPLRRHLDAVAALHTRRTWPRAWGRSICRMRLRASIRTRRRSGSGSTCFRAPSCPRIRRPGGCAGIT
jgi:integrase